MIKKTVLKIGRNTKEEELITSKVLEARQVPIHRRVFPFVTNDVQTDRSCFSQQFRFRHLNQVSTKNEFFSDKNTGRVETFGPESVDSADSKNNKQRRRYQNLDRTINEDNLNNFGESILTPDIISLEESLEEKQRIFHH